MSRSGLDQLIPSRLFLLFHLTNNSFSLLSISENIFLAFLKELRVKIVQGFKIISVKLVCQFMRGLTFLVFFAEHMLVQFYVRFCCLQK